MPGVQTNHLCGGIQYFDGQFDDARLLINLARHSGHHLVASKRYRETWSEQGYEFPVEGSDAPFEATLTDVGRLVAELTATPFATVRPECGPKPPKETIGIRFAGAVTTITWADCWDDEDGFVVEVIYSGTNAAGPVDDRVEYSVAANLTEFDLPAGDGLDGGCGLSMEVRLYVVRGADRQLANGIALINDCPGQG